MARRPLAGASWALAGVGALLPLLTVHGLANPTTTARSALILLTSFAIAAWIAATRTGRREAASLASFPLAPYVLVSLVTALWATDRAGATTAAFELASLLAVGWAASEVSRRGDGAELVTKATAVLALPIALLTLAQTRDVVVPFVDVAIKPSATFGNKNVLAFWLEAALPLALGRALPNHGLTRWRGLWTLHAAVVTAALCVTLSRGAALALLATGVVVTGAAIVRLRGEPRAAWKATRRTFGVALATIGAGIALGVVVASLPHSVTRPSNLVTTASDSAHMRLAFYEASLAMLRAHPWGVGIGGWRAAFPGYAGALSLDVTAFPWDAHSDLLQMLAETSPLGLGLFVLGAARVVRAGLAAKTTTGVARWLPASILVTFFHSAVDYPLHRPASAWLFWVHCGLLWGALERSRVKQPTLARTPPAMPDAGALASRATALTYALVALASTTFACLWVHADAGLRRAQDEIAAGRFVEAEAILRREQRLFPFHFLVPRSGALGAYLAYRAGSLDSGRPRTWLDAVLRNEPNQPRALLLSGHLARSIGDVQTARARYVRVLELSPRSSEARAGLAAMDRLGRSSD